jgi:UDP:flavonoid glycosyltransferase YjiC (YdhE family)
MNQQAAKRIVLTTFGTLGDVHPLIALCLELQQRGHHPVIAAAEMFRRKVEPLGIEFFPIRPHLNPEDSELVALLMDIRKGTERTLREVLFPAIRDTYTDLLAAVQHQGGAALLLSGELVYAAPLVAEKTGVPWASYVLAPLSYFSAYDPPVLPPYPLLARLESVLPGMGRGIARFARYITRHWAGPIYRLREELGLPRGNDPIFDAKHSPRLALAMFSPVLGTPQQDWPSSAVITGFAFYDGDAGKQELSPELESFLAAGDPPVVFTLGSVAVLDAGNFYEESARAAEMIGARAILLVGTDKRNLPAHTLPGTICVAEYAPYSRLFPRAAAIVHQGGVGTTAQALRAGKPMLVMPYSHDQPDNARRVQRLGVARILQRQHYTAYRAAKEIRHLLSSPKYARRAERIGFELQHENGVAMACDALESLLV